MKAQCLDSSETKSWACNEKVMSSSPQGDMTFKRVFLIETMRMMCRRLKVMMRMMQMRRKRRMFCRKSTTLNPKP